MKQSVSGGNGLLSGRISSAVGRMAAGVGLSRLLPSMRRLALLFLLAAVMALAATSPAQALTLNNVPHPQTWITNGTVNAIVRTTDTVYLGGVFSYVGPQTGPGVPLDAVTGESARTFPRVEGVVNACVADGAGGWFIGGSFTRVGDLGRKNLAHILASGELDPAWNPGTDKPINTLVISAGVLYVGGFFNSLDGQGRNHLAALEAATGALTAWNPNTDAAVYSLAATEGIVYVGGGFKTIGGQVRNNIAALDVVTGAVTAWNPEANGAVFALTVAGGVVYAGGQFSVIGGYWRNRLGALDPATGVALGWNPGVTGDSVQALAVAGSKVYAGGKFTFIGGKTRYSLAALNVATGAVTDWDPNLNYGDSVSALAAADGMVYVGGNFKNIGGQVRNGLAALDAVSGVPTAWGPGTDNGALALAVSGAMVYVGGNFSSAGGQVRNSLAALDVSTGAATAWNPRPGRNDVYPITINSLAFSDGKIYIAGDFAKIDGQTRLGLAAVDAGGILTAWNPSAENRDYLTLTAANGVIYVGGTFASIAGQTRYHLAALDATTGAALAWSPWVARQELQPPPKVTALLVSDGVVYVGGYFNNVLGQARNGLAAFDAATGAVTAWDPHTGDNSFNASITALAASGGTIYVGGNFINIGGKPRTVLAALDKTTAIATDWNPFAGQDSTYGLAVNALSVSEGLVYVGGHFSTCGGQNRSNVAAVDAATGAATAWAPDLWRNIPDASANLRIVNALAISGGEVYAGGGFTNVASQWRNSLALFIPSHTVSFQTDATPGASLAGATVQMVEPGAACTTVTAIAPSNYHFTKWTKDGADYSTDSLLTPTAVAADMAFVANFALNTHTVSFRTDGTTSATLRGPAAQIVNHGAGTAAVTAIAPVGYHFVKWTRDGVTFSTVNPLTVTGVTGDLTLTAVFARNTYTVSFKTDGTRGTTLTGRTTQVVNHGANATAVRANAPAGYRFVRWLSGKASYSTANPLVAVRITANTTLTAAFERIKCAVTFKTDGTRGATLTGRTTQVAYYGTGCTAVKANAPAGYHFVKWIRDGVAYSTANPLAIAQVPRTMTVVAAFAINSYTVTFKTDGTRGAKLTGTATQMVRYGGSATAVKAVAPKGYVFVKWTKGRTSYSTANPLTVRNVTATQTLVATFKKK